MKIQENISLAPLTTLEVGGPARYFVTAQSEEELVEAFAFARSQNLPVFVLGGGSNIVVSDKGFDGLVVQIALTGISIDGEIVTAAAGENWDALVERCISEDLAGFECLSGIPGTVGATPVQNVGAYGQEVSETIVSVRCYDRAIDLFVVLSNADCRFGYRTSAFNTNERDRYVVLSVTYELTHGGKPTIAYKDLLDYFDGGHPSPCEVRKAVLTIRRSKSMVIYAGDENRRSAGSFFKNPIVEMAKFEQIVGETNKPVPHFQAPNGLVKIPAAWLIEHAGFHKGFTMGSVGISTNHTLAIVNRGGATAGEVVELKIRIQAAVFEKFGITLVPEPIFIGQFEAKNDFKPV